jgi:hypothetical protein
MADGNSNEWMIVDLLGIFRITAFLTEWNHWHGAPASYKFETSLNGTNWTFVRNGSGSISAIDARYVRLYVDQGGSKDGIALMSLDVIGSATVKHENFNNDTPEPIILISPNPSFNGRVNIQLPLKCGTVKIFDIKGREVNYNTDYAPGVYLVRWIQAHRTISQTKMVVLH